MVSTSDSVILMALLANTARKMTDPSRRRYRMQQKTSVHLRSDRGPSRHCTESWMSSSLPTYLIFFELDYYDLKNKNRQGKKGWIRLDKSGGLLFDWEVG